MVKNAKLKIKEKQTKKTIKASKEIERKNTIWDIFKFGESYTSLILGIVVVIIATVILLTFVKVKNTPTKYGEQLVAKENILEQSTPTPSTTEPTPNKTQNLLKKEQKKLENDKNKVESKDAIVKPVEKNTNNIQTISGAKYTVVEGDTLWNISERKYKSGFNWIDIQKANNLTTPNLLFVGTKLTLPNVQPKIAAVIKPNTGNQQVSKIIQTNKISGSSYKVIKGDTLWDIALRAYGDGYAWTKIASANNLSNPNIIHSGNKLSIPRV